MDLDSDESDENDPCDTPEDEVSFISQNCPAEYLQYIA
ncbi:unnamed protein product [Anisakis simplex]|uniref:Maturin n=1 Tax=Anisakis simplex TaxID=6269 RepID=A0A0M3JKR1_ANISI|nr:unnamed protein product [Anisakis simplex]